MVAPLCELRRLIRWRMSEARDVAGFDLAALKMISKAASESTQSIAVREATIDVWNGMGRGSDLAAALVCKIKK